MRKRSRGKAYQRILTALAEIVEDGFPATTTGDLADRANVTDLDVHRFRAAVNDTRLEIANKGQRA